MCTKHLEQCLVLLAVAAAAAATTTVLCLKPLPALFILHSATRTRSLKWEFNHTLFLLQAFKNPHYPQAEANSWLVHLVPLHLTPVYFSSLISDHVPFGHREPLALPPKTVLILPQGLACICLSPGMLFPSLSVWPTLPFPFKFSSEVSSTDCCPVLCTPRLTLSWLQLWGFVIICLAASSDQLWGSWKQVLCIYI